MKATASLAAFLTACTLMTLSGRPLAPEMSRRMVSGVSRRVLHPGIDQIVAVRDTPPPPPAAPVNPSRPTYTSQDRPGDPFTNQTSSSPLLPDAPPGTDIKVELDSLTGEYVVYERIGQLDYRPVSTMTFAEYERWREARDLKAYNKAKSRGQENENALSSQSIVPRIFISPLFDRIFGGNYVDIRPNGSVLLDFGYRHQRVANPALPIRQQRNGQFLFDQQISLNAQGQIGEKLKVNINQDTKAAFEFDNTIKLDYTGFDHEILQKIEAGNVALPISSSLMSGARNLFGLKTTMQFGKLRVVSVISNQRGRAENKRIRNGAQTRDVAVRVNDYQDNQHYFLGHFFRNRYDAVLATPPVITSGTNVAPPINSGLGQPGAGGMGGDVMGGQIGGAGGQFGAGAGQGRFNSGTAQIPPSSINSGVFITRIELYVTNRLNNTTTLRNIIALQDLGEYRPLRPRWLANPADTALRPLDNNTNTLFTALRDQGERIFDINQASPTLEQTLSLRRGEDFEIIRGARRLQEGQDFVLQRQLGYLSLNTQLRDDEVLGVAMEYSLNGVTYKIGELQEDYQQRPDNSAIVLKLLRPSQIRLDLPTWDLQMKNIYSLGGGSISKDNFQMRIVYRDDSSGVDNPAMPRGRLIRDRPLVQVFNLDRLNPVNELVPDGNFDYIEGVTVDSRFGRIIFPVVEPFGRFLEQQFDRQDPNELALAAQFVFRELYTTTKTDALQAADKAKFFIIGRTQSTVSTEIQLEGFGLAEGSVRISAGSQQLIEGQDFSVDYALGRVTILNPGILQSGQELNIQYEKNDMFAFTQRSFFGSRFDYAFSKDITFGATVLYQNERPVIRRVAVGDEPSKNLMAGFDVNYRSDSRLLTRMVDALPLISTKEVSTVTASAEYAHIFPGSNRFVDPSRKGISFIDDFEGARTPVHVLSRPTSWRLASTPGQFRVIRPGADSGLSYNDRRARAQLYMVDATTFYNAGVTTLRPPNITRDDLQNHYVRPVGPREINRGRDLQQINLNEPILDFAYFPSERGPYNFSPSLTPEGRLQNSRQNWGGMMTAFTGQTDFDYSNIEFIEFWMMDPFIEGPLGAIEGNTDVRGRVGGRMTFDLGTISEDVMRDGRHFFENGLPFSQGQAGDFDQTPVGRVPRRQIVNRAFENTGRELQDVGLDGLSNADERQFYASYLQSLPNNLTPEARAAIEADPAADDFRFYLDPRHDQENAGIVGRYRYFNNPENNSPIPQQGELFPRQAYNVPDNEDLNEDNTLNELDAYFSYKIDFEPTRFRVGQNYIVDQIQGEGDSRWYLFRIPIRELTHPNALPATGGIQDFKTIKYLRMHLSGFDAPVVCRMYNLQFVATQWRKYPKTLRQAGFSTEDEDDASFSVTVVNIEENGAPGEAGQPKVPYAVPPGAQPRDRDITAANSRRLNEQSLSLCVDNLRDGDARASFKNVSLDFLNYGRIQMFVHAQSQDPLTRDQDMEVFLRLGTDYTENYYEVSVPLFLTPFQQEYRLEEIWQSRNFINMALSDLTAAKLNRNALGISFAQPFTTTVAVNGSNHRVTILGNPDLSTVLTVMIGVRNPSSQDQQNKSVCVWVNEMRVTDYIKNDGWAATGRVTAKLADLGTVNVSGKYLTPGFGGLEQRISERSRETLSIYNIGGNFALDKFLPRGLGLRLPLFVTYEQTLSSPQYDPLNPDILMSSVPREGRFAGYRSLVEDRTRRRGINFANIQKVRTKQGARPYPWDIENLSLSWAYSDMRRTNITIYDYQQRQINYGIGYNYSHEARPFEPFAKVSALSSPWFKAIQDLNFTPLPSSISVRMDLNRNFVRQQLRSTDVFAPPAPGLLTFEKSLLFNRTYGVRYAPFRSLTFDYSALAQAVVDEPFGDVRGNRAAMDTIYRNVRSGGRMKVFNQNIRAGYRVPFDKFPLTNFLSADVSYTAGLVWQASPLALQDTLGNTIQNSRDRAVNGRVDLTKLYNRVKLLSEINNYQPPARKPAARQPANAQQGRGATTGRGQTPPPGTANAKPAKDTTPKKLHELAAVRAVGRILMSLRTVAIQYQLTENTVLPGYRPNPLYAGVTPGFDGMPPSLPFLLGDQDPNIRFRAAEQGWLGMSRQQNSPFQQALTENLNINANIEPMRDFRLRLDVRRMQSSNYREIFRMDTLGFRDPSRPAEFMSLSPNRGGNYTISTIMIRSFRFRESADARFNRSETFQLFEANLPVVRDRLAADNPRSRENMPVGADTSQFPRYNQTSQDVLISAFRMAYQGQDARTARLGNFPQIPLPNWRLDWAGLSKIPALAELFPSITITHAYTSVYSVDNFTSSLRYGPDSIQLRQRPDILPTVASGSGEFVPVYNMTMITMGEKFAPLVGINVRTKSKVTVRLDYNRERALSLNISNAQITEIRSQDITAGVGFAKSGVRLPFKDQGRPIILKNELTIRADVTVRDNIQIQRKISDVNQVTNGGLDIQFRPTANYVVSQRLNVQVYFERTINNPRLASSFPRRVTAGGFQLRFALQ